MPALRFNARDSLRQAIAGLAILFVVAIAFLATPWARPWAVQADEQLGLVLAAFSDAQSGLARRCEALRSGRGPGPLGYEVTGLPSPLYVHKRVPSLTVEARVGRTPDGLITLRFVLPEIRGQGVWPIVEMLRGPDPIPEGTVILAALRCAPEGAQWGDLQARIPSSRLAAARLAAQGLR